jgi:RNA polymerase sigma-70 factor, ECF subfamily
MVSESEMGLLEQLTDGELVRRVIDRDELAFRALYRRHAQMLRGVIRRLLGGQTNDLEDILQETWLAACRAMRTYRGDARFSTWLVAIGVRLARRRLRLVDVRGEITDAECDAKVQSSVTEALDLERSLERLTDSQRAVLVLHDAQGFTHEEIGTLLGMPPGTSRSLLTRGRRAIRKFLSMDVSHD